ncbi:MAG TPA: hypothetical protein VKB93_27210 [Thermoanaerobaculia bacterium]|nr:hypothetical protein [Thermoanaerobaculia bacterium]
MSPTFTTALFEVMKWVLGALIGAYVTLVTVGAYSPPQFVLLLVAFVGVVMTAASALHSQRFAEAAKKLDKLEEVLGRPAEFFPRQLSSDDGHYFTEIARQIAKTGPGDTIWIVTSHLATPRSPRTKAVATARDAYHKALEDRAAHGVHVRRVFCFFDDVSPNAIDTKYLSLHTTDHCKRLWEIAKIHPEAVSIRASRIHRIRLSGDSWPYCGCDRRCPRQRKTAEARSLLDVLHSTKSGRH